MSAPHAQATVKLRPLHRSDAVTIARYMRLMAQDFGGQSRASATTLQRACFGPQRLARITAATCGGTIVAYIMTRDWMNFDHNAKVRHIQQLYVAEPYRGQGIATALLRHTAQQALRQQCFRLILDVGKNNRAARKLYLSLGFVAYSGRLIRHDLEEGAMRKLTRKG